MADTPKHKLFFGIPYGRRTVREQIPPNEAPPPTPSVEPCWKWDTGDTVFSSGSLRFDCDYDPAFTSGREQTNTGFTWDNGIVTMDTESKIYNS